MIRPTLASLLAVSMLLGGCASTSVTSATRYSMAAVSKQTEQFAGQVLFVHGDTHFFKVDKPLHAPTKLLPNFTRLQTFGSPSLHWVKVTVDPTTEHLFEIAPVILRQPGK